MEAIRTLSFRLMSTHPYGQKIDNHSYQHNSVKPQNTPIRGYKEVNGINDKHDDANADKPPSKLLMPLHIASLAAFDNALYLKRIILRLCHIVKTTKNE